MLKMTAAPPGGRGEIPKVGQIVKQTTKNDLLIFVRGWITASLRSALSWDPY